MKFDINIINHITDILTVWKLKIVHYVNNLMSDQSQTVNES